MEWFSQKTSIAGVQIPNWGIVRVPSCNLAHLFIDALSTAIKLAIGAIVIAHYEGQPVEIKITRIDRDYVRGRRIRKIWKDDLKLPCISMTLRERITVNKMGWVREIQYLRRLGEQKATGATMGTPATLRFIA